MTGFFNKKGFNVNPENQDLLSRMMLSVYTIARGQEINIKQILKVSAPKIPTNLGVAFFDSAEGSIKAMSVIFDQLNLSD